VSPFHQIKEFIVIMTQLYFFFTSQQSKQTETQMWHLFVILLVKIHQMAKFPVKEIQHPNE